ncbi:hypothetical protein KY284_032860 [Solanum tuberosum]|nr:hypothetical protein KY284_032860 [Solanum tuberosum]
MASLAVLFMHSGRWDSGNCYVDYTIEGVIFKESSLYKELFNVIAMQFRVDINVIKLKIEYKVEESNTLILIHNGMGVRVYIMLKKAANDFNKYPICISKLDNKPLCVLRSGSCDGVISDPCNKYVEVDQVYKDKATLKSVMEKYAIEKRFQYRTVRSNDKVYSQKHATSMLIGGIVKPKLVDHKRKYTPSDIRSDVKIYLGVDVNYSLAWRAKEKALISLRGTTSASYNKLLAYLYMMDITYLASIYACNRCCGSHLRGPYNGTDGEGHIFPLAYGIIDSENDAAWTWFFVQLKEAYGERSNMCVVSDRNESIIKAVTRVYNNVSHYACMWHLWGNVEKKFRKSSKELSPAFYTMAKTCNKLEFDRLLDTVEKVDVGVKEYLKLAGYDKWSRCHAETHRGWAMTSNIVESINGALVSARELSIFNFLEEVRLMFGRWNHDNKHEATCTFTPLIENFQNILVENEAMSTRIGVVPSTEYIHNLTNDDRSFVYKPMTVLKIYEISIYHLPDVAEWVIPEYIMYGEVRPLKFKRPPGRPKEKPCTKTTRELLGLKGSIHVAHVKLQVTIGIHVETGLKKFNELFRLYWSVILNFIDT